MHAYDPPAISQLRMLHLDVARGEVRMWRNASLALSTSFSASCQTDARGEKLAAPTRRRPPPVERGYTMDHHPFKKDLICATLLTPLQGTCSSLSESVAHSETSYCM